MIKRISLLIAAALMAVMMMAATAMPAMAAPITCQGNQTVVKDESGWSCETPSGSETGSSRHQGTGEKEGKNFPPKGR